MNLETSKTSKILNEISDELSLYKKYSHEALLSKFISDKLEKSLRYYDIQLEKSISYLSTRYGSEMLKALSAKTRKANKNGTLNNTIWEINND